MFVNTAHYSSRFSLDFEVVAIHVSNSASNVQGLFVVVVVVFSCMQELVNQVSHSLMKFKLLVS